MSTIPYGRQDINQADIDAVVAVLRSDFLTQGRLCPPLKKPDYPYRTRGSTSIPILLNHLYPVRIKQNEVTIQRQVYDAMLLDDINVNLHYIRVYRQPFYEAMGFNAGYCPEAEQYYQEVLSIPMFPTLTDTEQIKVIRVIRVTLE